MSYVSVDAPLPRNGRSPVPACETAAARATVQNVENLVAQAKAASSQIATPQSFAMLGDGVQRDVVRSQAELVAAQRLRNPQPIESTRDAVLNAPRVYPLNVPESEYSCNVRGIGSVQPMIVSEDQQRVIMPPRAPSDTNLLVRGNTGLRPERPMPARFRGMGVVWGDAIGDPRAVVPNVRTTSKGIVFLLALAGVGLFGMQMGKKGRR